MNATVTVRRPDGTIEVVESKLSYILPHIFEEMKKVTAAAGRGAVISYDNHGNKPIQTGRGMTVRQQYGASNAASNKAAGRCPHCGGYCDGDCRD